MDLTPRDIQDKQFHDAFRGYNHEEVDLFLDQIAESFDKVFSQNQTFHHRLQQLEEELEQARSTDDMLKRTLLTASRTAEEAIEEARSKAEVMIAAANSQAAEIVAAAEQRRDDMMSDAEHRAAALVESAQNSERELQVTIEGLKNFSREYRARLKAFISSQLHAIETGPDMPADVPPSAAPQRPMGGRTEERPMGGRTEERPMGGRTEERPMGGPKEENSNRPTSASGANGSNGAAASPSSVGGPSVKEGPKEGVPATASRGSAGPPERHPGSSESGSPLSPSSDDAKSNEKAPSVGAPATRSVSIPEPHHSEVRSALSSTATPEAKPETERSIKELFWGEE